MQLLGNLKFGRGRSNAVLNSWIAASIEFPFRRCSSVSQTRLGKLSRIASRILSLAKSANRTRLDALNSSKAPTRPITPAE
jgi:hypothetical protein